MATAAARLTRAATIQRFSANRLHETDPVQATTARSVQAASAAGSTMTDVSLVAIARPAATPASVDQPSPPPVITRPTAITNASVKHAKSDSWMNIRE